MNLKGKYSGPILLIGNGPSLNDYDLSDFRFPTMAMNGISALYRDTIWRPTFYVCVSSAAAEDRYLKHMKPSVDSAGVSFLNHKTQYANERSVLLHRDETLTWHDDITEQVGVFGTTTFACMQIIAWMGFDSVYMIGFDGGYKKPVDGVLTHYFSRQYPKSGTVNYDRVDWKRLNKDHQKALTFGIGKLNERSIKVYSFERLE